MLTPEEEERQRQLAGMISQTALSNEDRAALVLQAAQSSKGTREGSKRQQAMADRLRGAKGPQGRTAGKIFMAANPLEFLGDVANKGVGAYASMKANEAEAEADVIDADVLAAAQGVEDDDLIRQRQYDRAVLEEGRGHDQTLLTASIAAQRIADGERVEMSNGKEIVQALELDGKLYESDGVTPWTREGFKENYKVTRGSGSLFSQTKGKDPYDNDVFFTFDKGTGSNAPSQFIDGTPYSEEEAKRRGGIQIEQSAAEEGAKERAKGYVQTAEDITAGMGITSTAIATLKEANALIDKGVQTGPLANRLTTLDGNTKKLENLQQQLGLIQLSKNTFGSLSEKEGQWVREVEIPLDLDEDELGGWIDHKIEGMERAQAADQYRLDELDAGRRPDQAVIDAIKYGGGYSFSYGD